MVVTEIAKRRKELLFIDEKISDMGKMYLREGQGLVISNG
jgi:hypothetical protein